MGTSPPCQTDHPSQTVDTGDRTGNGNVTLSQYYPEELTERLWTVEDVAAFIRVPAATLRKWRHTGHPLGLLGVRVGKRVVWDPRDVRAWWERTKRAGVSGDPTAVNRVRLLWQ
jgi:hypothetical protein